MVNRILLQVRDGKIARMYMGEDKFKLSVASILIFGAHLLERQQCS